MKPAIILAIMAIAAVSSFYIYQSNNRFMTADGPNGAKYIINKMTGESKWLVGGEIITVPMHDQAEKKCTTDNVTNTDNGGVISQALPDEQMALLQGRVWFRYTEVHCDLYNGSEFRVAEIIIHVAVTIKGTKKIIVRDLILKPKNYYEVKGVGTFECVRFAANSGFRDSDIETYTWTLSDAVGHLERK